MMQTEKHKNFGVRLALVPHATLSSWWCDEYCVEKSWCPAIPGMQRGWHALSRASPGHSGSEEAELTEWMFQSRSLRGFGQGVSVTRETGIKAWDANEPEEVLESVQGKQATELGRLAEVRRGRPVSKISMGVMSEWWEQETPTIGRPWWQPARVEAVCLMPSFMMRPTTAWMLSVCVDSDGLPWLAVWVVYCPTLVSTTHFVVYGNVASWVVHYTTYTLIHGSHGHCQPGTNRVARFWFMPEQRYQDTLPSGHPGIPAAGWQLREGQKKELKSCPSLLHPHR